MACVCDGTGCQHNPAKSYSSSIIRKRQLEGAILCPAASNSQAQKTTFSPSCSPLNMPKNWWITCDCLSLWSAPSTECRLPILTHISTLCQLLPPQSCITTTSYTSRSLKRRFRSSISEAWAKILAEQRKVSVCECGVTEGICVYLRRSKAKVLPIPRSSRVTEMNVSTQCFVLFLEKHIWSKLNNTQLQFKFLRHFFIPWIPLSGSL